MTSNDAGRLIKKSGETFLLYGRSGCKIGTLSTELHAKVIRFAPVILMKSQTHKLMKLPVETGKSRYQRSFTNLNLAACLKWISDSMAKSTRNGWRIHSGLYLIRKISPRFGPFSPRFGPYAAFHVQRRII